MANKYLMGLDIGTDSVGWCVTDENNDVVKVSNKYLIGSRLFEQAEAKAERRQHRAARRRLARRARRIDLLQGLFAKEMSKVDPKFFIRLNNSFYQKEEKDSLLKDEYSIAQHDALFAGIGGYSDSQFHKEYPTIHHLILHLMKTTEKADIRLIYLACHFLIKYRGNFLHDNLKSISDQTEIKTQFQVAKDYLDKIHQNLGEEANLDCFTNDDNISKFIEITKKNGRINYLKAEFEKLFGVKTSYLKDVFYPLLAGSQVDVKKIFNYLDESEINLPENETKVKLDSESFDSILPSVAEIAGTDWKGYLLILAAKKIRDFETTNRLLGNATSLSEAMVNRYQTHKQDLKWLKQWVKSHSVEGEKPSLYDQVFHDTGDKKIANYASYIASDRGKSVKRCKYKDFTDFLKKQVFSNYFKEVDAEGNPVSYEKNEEIKTHFCDKIDAEDFLPRQNSHLNGVFPYQFHLFELEDIIKNQAPYYPFLNDSYTRKDGKTVNKICSILTWKIPYFIGPLKQKHNQEKNVWAVINTPANEPIYPWSMEDQIDYAKSEEKFIRRMTGKCSYYYGANTLPRYSLLYTEYVTVNWLNGCVIDGNPIPWDKEPSNGLGEIGRKQIIEYFFKEGKTNLQDFLDHEIGKGHKITYSSNKEIKDIPSMKPWAYFKDEIKAGKKDLVENVLKDLAIFEDKSTLIKRLKSYGFDESRSKDIANQPFKKFGNLSAEFLNLKTENSYIKINEYGEAAQCSLLDIMKYTGQTMMAVLNNKNYGFIKELDRIREEALGETSGDKDTKVRSFIDELYVSPLVKRPIYQAYKIIEEVQQILRAPIDEYYVECTRQSSNPNTKGKKSKTRYEILEGFYEKAESEKEKLKSNQKYKAYFDNSNKKLIDEKDNLGAKVRSDKIYLYFMQLGRCMYTLEKIDFGRLCYDEHYCEIDHIIPQSLLKDDSLENRVLVLHDANQKKAAEYPIPQNVLNPEARTFYKYLKDIHLLSDVKYAKLTRTKPLSDDEKVGFVNRQLTTTNQAVIGTINLIKTFEKRKDGSEPFVRYSKAELVSEFREHFDLLKCREANDLHHAYDAYLNIIVGRTMWAYFPERIEIIKRRVNEAYEEDVNDAKTSSDSETQEKKKTNVFIRVFNDLPKRLGEHKDPVCDKDGFIAWNYAESLAKIEKQMYERQGTVLVTVRPYCDTAIFKEIGLHPQSEVKPDGSNMFPIKENLPSPKYGGYNSLKVGFFSIIKEKNKKGEVRSRLIRIRTMDAPNRSHDEVEKAARAYCSTKQTEFVGVEVYVVKLNTVFQIGQSRVQVSSSNTTDTSYAQPLIQLHFRKDEYRMLRALSRVFKEAKGANGGKSEVTDAVTFEKCLNKSSVFSGWDENKIVVTGGYKERAKEISISSDDLVHLYDLYKDKLSSQLYSDISKDFAPAKAGRILKENRGQFISMNIISKCLIMKSIVDAAAPRLDNTFYLHSLDEKSKELKKYISNILPPKIKLIHQSVTGFFEKVIWENKEE